VSAAKALAYALCDKLESKKVDEVVRNLVSSGWNIREVAWKLRPLIMKCPTLTRGGTSILDFLTRCHPRLSF
jgi:type VI protein secretion system component VasF